MRKEDKKEKQKIKQDKYESIKLDEKDVEIKTETFILKAEETINNKILELYNLCYEKKINKDNYQAYYKQFMKIDVSYSNSKEQDKYFAVSHHFKSIELEIDFEKMKKTTTEIKTEILTMMGLFFAIFTFVQVNFTFTQQFLEKYNGYRLLLYITIINAVLLIVLGFILEAIGTIVYGENKAREEVLLEEEEKEQSIFVIVINWIIKRIGTKRYFKSQKYFLFFPESRLKLKRALIYALLGLFVVGTFSFYKEKKNYSRSYEEIDQIIMKKVEDKISSINKTLSEDEKKQIKLEIENSIYRDLYNQSKKAPQVK